MPVQTRQIGIDTLRVRQAKTDRVNSVEASMRLDAVASAGFRMSRSKLLDVIKAGDIRCGAPACYLRVMTFTSCTAGDTVTAGDHRTVKSYTQ